MKTGRETREGQELGQERPTITPNGIQTVREIQNALSDDEKSPHAPNFYIFWNLSYYRYWKSKNIEWILLRRHFNSMIFSNESRHLDIKSGFLYPNVAQISCKFSGVCYKCYKLFMKIFSLMKPLFEVLDTKHWKMWQFEGSRSDVFETETAMWQMWQMWQMFWIFTDLRLSNAELLRCSK